MARKKLTVAPATAHLLGKKPREVTPDAPVVPEVTVEADALGTPEGARPAKPDHIMPKPTFTLLEDGRYREDQRDHPRTVTIDGVQYEHVAEDKDGRWVYARS